MNDKENNQKNCENIWSNLLQEVQEKTPTKRQIPNSLLILGNERSGKSSLIARLQKCDTKSSVGLEFQFIDVNDEAIDVNNQLNVWIAPGDIQQSNLIKYALEKNNFQFTMCIIVVSFEEPWSIIDNIELWLGVLGKHIDQLKLNPEQLAIYKESLFRHFQDYSDPSSDKVIPISAGKRRDTTFNFLHPITSEGFLKVFVPLQEEVLENNFGIPIIVVMTKTDQMANLEQNYQYDDDTFDFIQMNIRKLCLKYGAALCYTSMKDGLNCGILLRYILHRCYGFPFLETASVTEKDAIFIPAGWDNGNKINILADNLPSEIKNQHFCDFISKPLSLIKSTALSHIKEPKLPDEDQVFLKNLQSHLLKIKTSILNYNTNLNKDPIINRVQSPTISSSLGARRRNQMKSNQSTSAMNPSNYASRCNQGNLANVFGGLLNKRRGLVPPQLTQQQSTSSEPGKCSVDSSDYEDDLKFNDTSDSVTSDIEENRRTKVINPIV